MSNSVNISKIFLGAVFLLTAVRQVGRLKLQIWQIMLAGALAVLLAGQISLPEALRAMNVDVLLFLIGMFVVGHAMEESGYLAHITYMFFRRAGSLSALVIMVLAGSGLLSALLMNDTLAVVGTPVMLLLARKHGMRATPLLLALAFGVTIGSVFSPIGNPQNLLIALHGGLANPFVEFLRRLYPAERAQHGRGVRAHPVLPQERVPRRPAHALAGAYPGPRACVALTDRAPDHTCPCRGEDRDGILRGGEQCHHHTERGAEGRGDDHVPGIRARGSAPHRPERDGLLALPEVRVTAAVRGYFMFLMRSSIPFASLKSGATFAVSVCE